MKYKTNTCISRPSPNTPQIHHKYETNTKALSYLDADHSGGGPRTMFPQQSQAAACHAYTDMPCAAELYFLPLLEDLPPAAIASPTGTGLRCTRPLTIFSFGMQILAPFQGIFGGIL